MDKKKCLKCEKEYQPKKETSKFCSTSCRVMWGRKNKSAVSQNVQMKDMLNSMLDMMEKINNKIEVIPTLSASTESTKNAASELREMVEHKKMNIVRSFDYYRQARTECETQEQWEELKYEIMNAENLSTKQKTLLTT